MKNITISIEEMIEYIYNRCTPNITKHEIEMILDLQEDFLTSKGLIEIEKDDTY